MNNGLKIIIVVNDSIVRKTFSAMIAENKDVKETLLAANCKIALARIKQNDFDLMLLDIGIPDCLDSIKTIYRDYPHTSIIVVSNSSTDAGNLIIEALEYGAIDVLPRVDQNTPEAVLQDTKNRLKILLKISFGRRSIQKTKALIKDGLENEFHHPKPMLGESTFFLQDLSETAKTPTSLAKFQPHPADLRVEVVVIGVSTGGPNALARVIPNLPANFKTPVLIVQHMPEFLTKHLAANLDQKSVLKVKEAVDGEELNPGIVYLAPGGKHMVVTQRKMSDKSQPQKVITLNIDPPENSCRPSVDVLLMSIAASYHGNVLVVIMTGMGSDGMKGIKALKEKGGYCLSQTKDTCAVYGMPRVVDEAGLSDEKIPLENMAERIIALTQKI
jgi:two-component system, chemotaxis family, protein-glutamate methylesterase/glutaminase